MNSPDQKECLCHVELLGPLRVTGADKTQTQFATQKAGALLAYLALRPGPHPRERVIDLLWPDRDIAAGRNNLSTTLVSLRRQLEPAGARRGSVLVTTQADVGLNPDTVSTDVALFEDLLKRAARSGGMAQRADFLQRAADLYRGDLLPGNYQDWAVREAERLRARLQEALQQLALDLEALGELASALHTAQRSAALDPYSEENHCRLIRLYVLSGQIGLAKEAHGRFERLLAEEFGADLAPSTRQRIAQIFKQPAAPARSKSDLTAPFAPVRAEDAAFLNVVKEEKRARSTLPVALGRYFGREAEIVRLARLLVPGKGLPLGPDAPESPCRLVTLTGPGGMGKTRLALEFARQAGTRFNLWHGFVSLADLTQAAQIPAQIAGTLKLSPDTSGDPLAPVCDFLNAQDSPDAPPLLILDNLEHLLPREEEREDSGGEREETGAEAGGSPVVDCIQTLLARVPGLLLLCTSRRRVGVRGEHLLALTPLPVPDAVSDASETSDLARMLAVPSIRLYVDRAQAVRPDFGLTPTNAPAVAALCRQLEGSPLALELAAAWVRALPPRKMWERLTQGQDIPPGSYADLPARHRTLSAALEWSFRLLTPTQQRLFARLSAFRGGWTPQAAEAVCEEPDALFLLSALQEASLVTAAPDGEDEEQMRYAFLETVRAFSRRHLDAVGEAEVTDNAHAAFFLTLAEQAEAQLRGVEQAKWLTRLEADHDNIRAALDRCLSAQSGREQKEIGARLVCAMFPFWNIRGHWAEARRCLAAAHVHAEAGLPAPLRARLLNMRAGSARLVGDLAQAQALFEESLQIWRSLSDPKGVASLLHNLGFIALLQGQYARAQPLYEESLALERERGDVSGVADELHHLGWLAHEQGDLARARALYEESLAMRRPLGDLRGNAFTLQNLANLTLAEGDYAQARTLQEENMAIRRALGDRIGTADALHNLGRIAQEQGEEERAVGLYRDALEIRRELGDKLAIASSVETLASVALTNKQWTRAARLYAAISALRAQAGLPRSPGEEEEQAEMKRLQEQLSPEAFAAAWNAGSALTWEQAAAEALEEI